MAVEDGRERRKGERLSLRSSTTRRLTYTELLYLYFLFCVEVQGCRQSLGPRAQESRREIRTKNRGCHKRRSNPNGQEAKPERMAQIIEPSDKTDQIMETDASGGHRAHISRFRLLWGVWSAEIHPWMRGNTPHAANSASPPRYTTGKGPIDGGYVSEGVVGWSECLECGIYISVEKKWASMVPEKKS